MADCFTLSYPADLSPIHFIRLRLTDAARKMVSENFYWRGVEHENFRGLDDLKPVDLQVTSQTTQEDGEQIVTASFTNPAGSGTVAFAIRPMLLNPHTGDQILPVHTSDGYFFLLPGETRKVVFRCDPAAAGGVEPKVVFESYNNAFNSLPQAADKTGNFALDKYVAASSTDSHEKADPAVDGELKTRWLSLPASGRQWLMVDLEKSRKINRVNVSWDKAFATSYSVQVSDDAKAWSDIQSTTTGKGGKEELTGLEGQGRYIRLLATQPTDPKGVYAVSEIEVFGQ